MGGLKGRDPQMEKQSKIRVVAKQMGGVCPEQCDKLKSLPLRSKKSIDN